MDIGRRLSPVHVLISKTNRARRHSEDFREIAVSMDLKQIGDTNFKKNREQSKHPVRPAENVGSPGTELEFAL